MLLQIISQLQRASTSHPFFSRLWHEILFGYTGAFLAGFLLTAVRNWTGVSEPKEKMLVFLLILWLLARILPYIPGQAPIFLAAAAELTFFAVLTALIAGSLIQTRSRNSYVVIELLIIFMAGVVLTRWAQLGWWIESGTTGLRLSLYSAIAMLIILSGRVLPFTIQKTLQIERPPTPNGQLMETTALLAIYVLMILETLTSVNWLAGLISLLVAIGLGARISSYYHPDIRHHPLLWIEFSGLLWIAMGFVIHAAAAMALLSNDAGLPALLAGGIGIMSVGMMVRVIQGHTGNTLQDNTDVTAAFYLLNIGTLALVAGVVAPADIEQSLTLISKLCWLFGFAFLLKACGPLLLMPPR